LREKEKKCWSQWETLRSVAEKEFLRTFEKGRREDNCAYERVLPFKPRGIGGQEIYASHQKGGIERDDREKRGHGSTRLESPFRLKRPRKGRYHAGKKQKESGNEWDRGP